MADHIRVRYPVNSLVSFHYMRTRDLSVMLSNGMHLVGDSGAFSAATQGAPIDVHEFGAWAKKWHDKLAWVASLDVIGDSDATWRNYRTLRDRYSVQVVPTIHYGCNPSALDKYAADGVDFVGLGGMVQFKSEPQRLLRWCLRVFKYARDHHPQMRFHGWGVTHPQLLFQLPWYSVDSTGWAYGFMLGKYRLWNPSTATIVRFNADGKDAYKHADFLRRHYNVEPQEVATCSPANMDTVVRMSARAYQLMEDHLRKRFNVSVPKYGCKPTAPTGINIHLANGSAPVFEKHLRPYPTDLEIAV